MLNTKSIRRQFKVYKKNPDLHFFDSAASALKLAKAVDAMAEYLNYNGTNVHRGVYKLASDATELYENARESIANVIHANKDEVIFTKSTTHSLNMLAKSLESILTKVDEIIISELEHHSNLLPWFELAKNSSDYQIYST